MNRITVIITTCVVLLGCSETSIRNASAPGTAATSGADASKGGPRTVVAPTSVQPPFPPDPIVRGLGNRLAIRETATTLEALLEKVKPDFVLNGYEMMWIGKDEKGQREFVLDRAFVYQPKGEELKWVLLEYRDAPHDEWYAQVMGYHMRGVARLHAQAPTSDHGAGDYAVVMATHPESGTLYEVGWQALISGGTACEEVGKRLYLLESARGKWRFVGEGPKIVSGLSGYCISCATSITAEITWTGSTEAPVKIVFTERMIDHEWASSDDPPTFRPRPDRVTYSEWALEGELPAKLREITEKPYMVAEEGQTLESVADLLTAWSIGAERVPNAKQKWLERLRELNPGLSGGEIPKGTRILVPSGYRYVPGEIGNK